jgi:uncharacterized membrane protein YidH (DUF202 family)
MRPRRARDPAPETVFDRGLQQERTALAWDRTGLAFMVAGALFVRGGEPPYHHPRHIPGFLVVVVGGALVGVAARRYHRQHAHLRQERPVASPGLVRFVGLAAVAFSLAAAGLVVFGA